MSPDPAPRKMMHRARPAAAKQRPQSISAHEQESLLSANSSLNLSSMEPPPSVHPSSRDLFVGRAASEIRQAAAGPSAEVQQHVHSERPAAAATAGSDHDFGKYLNVSAGAACLPLPVFGGGALGCKLPRGSCLCDWFHSCYPKRVEITTEHGVQRQVLDVGACEISMFVFFLSSLAIFFSSLLCVVGLRLLLGLCGGTEECPVLEHHSASWPESPGAEEAEEKDSEVVTEGAADEVSQHPAPLDE